MNCGEYFSHYLNYSSPELHDAYIRVVTPILRMQEVRFCKITQFTGSYTESGVCCRSQAPEQMLLTIHPPSPMQR